MQAMTQSEYAAHRGVSRQAINKLVKGKRIPVSADGKIDAAAADFALGENRARLDEPRPPAPPLAPTADSGGLTRARTATEVYKARMAQLAYEKQVGNALSRDGVVEATVAFGEVLTRTIGGLSRRIDEIAAAAARDAGSLRACLKGIEFDMRKQMADAIAKLGEQAVAARDDEAAPALEESESE